MNGTWTYDWNNPGVPEDGFVLLSPDGRQVGMVDHEDDAKLVVGLLNKGAKA